MIKPNRICSKTLCRKFWKSSILYIMKRTFSHKTKIDKNHKSIDDYTPSGNLLYNKDLLKKIENKVLK